MIHTETVLILDWNKKLIQFKVPQTGKKRKDYHFRKDYFIGLILCLRKIDNLEIIDIGKKKPKKS